MKQRKKKSDIDPFGGFLADLFPDDFIAYAMQDLFARDIIRRKMNHDGVREALIEHTLHNTPIQLFKQENKQSKIMATYKVNITQGDSYDIHDNTGCTMNFGKKRQPEESEEYTDYEEVKDGEEETNHPIMTVEDKIRYCIVKLEEDAMINFKQDYAVVLRVIQEKNIKFFTNESFARFISAMDAVPANHKPNEGNIKMMTFSEKNKMPNLKVVGCDDEKNLYYNGIANRFWSLFCSLK